MKYLELAITMNNKICISQNNIAAVVVVYHPVAGEVRQSIMSYINDVDHLYIIDNTPDSAINSHEFFGSTIMDNASYISMNGNAGVAAALNTAASKAIIKGYSFLLTMDQDTMFPSDALKNLFNAFNNMDNRLVGIISPTHVPVIPKNSGTDKQFNAIIEYNGAVMTSANILSLSAYNKVGNFIDDYFIDDIDHEFCFRLEDFDLKVATVKNIYVEHKVGNTEKRNFFNRKVFITNHNPLRLYYRTRNRLYTLKKHGLHNHKISGRPLLYEYLRLIVFDKICIIF